MRSIAESMNGQWHWKGRPIFELTIEELRAALIECFVLMEVDRDDHRQTLEVMSRLIR